MSGKTLKRCSCGQPSVVGLNNAWLCQACFKAALADQRAVVDRLVRLAKRAGGGG